MSSDTSTGMDTATPEDLGEDPIIGKVIDGCKVIRKLGQGGMGVVYLAEHETLGQDFVLKILNPALTGAEDTVERFFREAQACAQLNHPGIVAIQNVGQEGDYYYIRMEYVEGDTLEELVREQKQIDWQTATSYVIDVAEALSHAHQKGMIHRDIKPENIMLTPKGEVKVMDFGLAKHVHSSAKVSVTGQIVGTPFFMSPEQAGGKPTDARSDIYSLGVTLYYMMTGVKPFNGKNLQEIFLKHFFYAPESPKIYNDSLPDSLCDVVKRCLKKKKKERYQSAKALALDLRGVLDDPTRSLEEISKSGGGAKAPAPAGGDEGDMTIATGPTDEGGATVRVGAEEDGGGATIKVSDGGDDGQTVAVGAGGRRERGEVKSVSFTSASMVFNEDDATLQIDQEEDAHAGLDLPTSVINAAMGGDMELEEEVEEEKDPETLAAERRSRKKKLIVLALVVLIPSLFMVGMQVTARSKFSQLSTQYNDLRKESQAAKTMDKALASKWEGMAQDFQEFADGYVLAPNLTPKAAEMAAKSRAEAERILKRYKDEEAERKRLEHAKKAEIQRQKDLAELKKQAESILEELNGARAATDVGSSHWKEYTERALTFLEEFGPKRSEFPELKELLDQVEIPVQVTSDPGSAQIFLDQNRDAEPQRTPPEGTGLVWVPPNIDFSIRVFRRGFQEWRSKVHTSERFYTIDAPLSRKLVRAPFSFGELRVQFGASNEAEAVVPVHEPQVFASGAGLIYFVGRGGLLRAFKLESPGRLEWSDCPGGISCEGVDANGNKVPEVHRVGFYGDPTPEIDVVEEVILVSSQLGYVSAHDRSKGHIIWRTKVGAPVTSPPRYQLDQIVAAGTSTGEVVFLTQSGRIHWRYQTSNSILTPPYLLNTLCVVGSTDNRVHVLDWKQKKRLGWLDLGDDVVVGPVPAGRRLLVGTALGQLHLIDIAKPSHPTIKATYGPGDGRAISGVAVVELDEGRGIFFSAGKHLYAVNESGASLWKGSDGKEKSFYSPRGSLTRPVVHPNGGLIYVGGGQSGVLYAIDRATGRERWRFSTPRDASGARSSIDMAPFVFGDELFVVSGEKVYVLSLE